MRNDILDRKNDIINWISNKYSKHFICQQLHCKEDTLNKYLDVMGIEYSGDQSGKGFSKNNLGYIPLLQYLKESKSIKSTKVRTKLLREGYKKHECESCHLTEWNGKPIPLELHHIDGDHHNNTLSNFQLLCPNCHAFTDSYRGRNKRMNNSTV